MDIQSDSLKRLLDNQKREIRMRAAELQLKSDYEARKFQHAAKVLETQARDRLEERQFMIQAAKHRYIFIAILVGVAIIFLAVLAVTGKEQMAMEVLKAGVYLSAGAISGFFYGKSRQRELFSHEDTEHYD